jgi:hypothetical protein
MDIPEVINHTPFAFAPLYVNDENSRPLLVLLTRASLLIDPSGTLSLAPQQQPIQPAGVFWKASGEGSYKFEPDFAFTKVTTDVALVGHAYASQSGTTQMDVAFRVGALQTHLRVFGDRVWSRGLSGWSMSDPQAFELMPLCYDRAFGGWDRSLADPLKHTFEPRNPCGTGFIGKGSLLDDVPIPNIENPRELISSVQDRPMPLGVGFTSPDWQPRAAFAGTYDALWVKNRQPRLPLDFDRRYFNAASTNLVAPNYLLGNETVVVHGATPHGRLQFSLPGVQHMRYRVRLRNQPVIEALANLDTVVVDGDQSLLYLTWRAAIPLKNGAQDVQEIVIQIPGREVVDDIESIS